MASENLSRSLEEIFGHEGGYTSSRSDPGNWTGGAVGKGQLKGTKFGIAAHSYPDLDIRNLTLAEATEIYRRDYAGKIRFDDLPSGVDHAMLDFAVNSGPSRSVKFTQRIVGVDEDGAVGPITLKSIRAFNAEDLVNRLCDARMAFLRKLPIWPIYKNGWTKRVKEVRAFAIELAQKAPSPNPELAIPQGYSLIEIILNFFRRHFG